MRKVINTENTPNAVGPYSDAVRVGNLLVCGGQGPIDPVTQRVYSGEFEQEVRITMNNLKAAVEAGGSSMENLVKVNVYLTDINDFESFGKVYREFFKDRYNMPTRVLCQVAGLWGGIRVEVEALAYVED
ncbi:RidA family protein [Bacillus sp. V5-8f]|uniref:RidA family protein n=1 Tax=Bacillus sp. V5-8f TaxID=2053044 RepID=UPI0015E0729A|nr:Rid family detoxifying hydrolase [Bacillus sp. V5-8f]